MGIHMDTIYTTRIQQPFHFLLEWCARTHGSQEMLVLLAVLSARHSCQNSMKIGEALKGENCGNAAPHTL